MADRTSARLFGDLFDLLAEQPQDKRTKKLATRVLEMTNDYDFTTDQMGCDAALAKLGIDSMIGEEDSLDAPTPSAPLIPQSRADAMVAEEREAIARMLDLAGQRAIANAVRARKTEAGR